MGLYNESMMNNQGSPYLLYVLSLWCDDQDVPWHAALECARTGERFPFASLSDLFTFLEAETQASQMAVPLVSYEDNGRGEKSQTSDA